VRDLPEGDIRLVQVARMLQLGSHTVDDARARAEIAARPADFARALFEEAAANDDVTSPEAALDYLEGRLSELNDLIADDLCADLRREFAGRLRAWAS
jgi:hypothetical protein